MNLQKTILAVAAILIAVFILTLAPSCSFQKDINKTETNTKAESRTEDSLRIESLRRDTSEYLRQLREREYFEAQMDCPELDTAAIKEGFAGYVPISFLDSVLKANTRPIRTATVEKGADGSVKITGNNIRSVRYIKEKDEKEISRYTSTIQTLIESQIETMASVVQTKKEKEKHSKGGLLNFNWLWIIPGLLFGMYLGWRLRGGIKLIDKLNPSNMKNLILVFFASLLLTSCGHYRDGSSVWQAGMWIAPLLTFIGFAYFLTTAWKSSRSGSNINIKYGGGESGNVPIWKLGRFYFAVIFFLATIAIIWAVNAEK